MILRRAAAVLAIVVVAAVGQRWLDRLPAQVDLTANESLTLSEQTREVVARLRRPVEITAFVRRTDPGRAEAASLLRRYQRLDRRIRTRVLDPDTSPGETRRLGVQVTQGGVALVSGSRIEHAPLVSEQDLTAGIARLLRPTGRGVCIATGHGEPDPGGRLEADLGGAVGLLVSNGYRVRRLDLLVHPTVPSDCGALLLAGPQVPFNAVTQEAIAGYLSGGGRALILAEAGSTVDINALVRPYGLAAERGLVLEGDPDARLGGDPVTPVVRRFTSASPVVRRLPPAIFPGAQAVVVDEQPKSGLTASVLASTTRLAYLERNPSRPNFEAGIDVPGPHALAAAADLSGVVGGKVRRTRIVLVGDVTFATNDFIGEGGNARFFVQAMDWLTLDEDLVSVSTNLPAYRPLELTARRVQYARFIAIGFVPGLFALAGLLVWAVRRGR